ncbi:hypothetical protein K7432_009646 [Basidiobolus ranarum]|uniref:Uncharacterized protein n=1 Tax=Basidiobolus ranarum TaxID=34480 RepID=A0ABR2WPW5_9FUNG
MIKIIVLFTILTSQVYARINRIIAYADSYTDNGNDFRYSGFPPAPYYEGRFSNGPTWIDYTTKNLGLSQINHGFGGATSNNDYIYSIFNGFIVPGFKQQIDRVPPPSGNQEGNLYAVFFAANDISGLANPGDFYIQKKYTTNTIIDNIVAGIEKLIAKYKARNFIVFNQPPLDRFPIIKSKDKPYFKDLINRFNSDLFKRVDMIENAKVIHVDVHAFFTGILNNPTKYGFKNTKAGCFNIYTKSLCKNVSEHVLWDRIHPTADVHKLLGDYVTTIISKNFDI